MRTTTTEWSDDRLAAPICYEAINDTVVRAFHQGLTRLQSLVMRLDEIDVSRGAGRINENTKCVWTFDGYRITFSIIDGCLIAALSSKPDPLADPLLRRSA